MRTKKRRLPIPQHEFGFAPSTFNLIQEAGFDGERIARETQMKQEAQRAAKAAQPGLFATPKHPKTILT
jgi:hypothetical protein